MLSKLLKFIYTIPLKKRIVVMFFGQPMKYLSFLLLLQCFFVSVNAASVTEYFGENYGVIYSPPKTSKSDIINRLEVIESSVGLRYNKEVKRYINSFVKGGRRSTEKIIGRSAIYFPIFEYYLDLYNLPSDLKFLAIVESALEPGAVSPKGAGGLWQFIRSTARLYGLEINSYVDERYDIHKSSEAAVRLLSDLYDLYGDWSLAIAAYNSGTVNINKAIKKSGSRDFWKIRKHLPKETREYVPKFIAVSYVMNYYHFYDLRPEYPDYNLQLTAVTKVYDRYSFKQLASDSGISLDLIKQLNPSFKKQIIPPSVEGYNLILPRIGLASTFEYELFGLK